MRSHTTRRYREAYQRLPESVKRQARRAYRRFMDNPSHSGLRFKRVHATERIYSARVSRDYRVLGVLAEDDDVIVWFWIGPHAEYDEVLKRL